MGPDQKVTADMKLYLQLYFSAIRSEVTGPHCATLRLRHYFKKLLQKDEILIMRHCSDY